MRRADACVHGAVQVDTAGTGTRAIAADVRTTLSTGRQHQDRDHHYESFRHDVIRQNIAERYSNA